MLRHQLRRMSTGTRTPSPHAGFYRDTLPAMGPVFLIASAVYMVRSIAPLCSDVQSDRIPLRQGLKLAQSKLAHEKFVLETKARIVALEQELETLRVARSHPAASSLENALGGGSAQGPASSKSWYAFWK